MSTRFFGKKDKERTLSSSLSNESLTPSNSQDDDDADFSILDNKNKTLNYLTKWISNRNAKLKEKGLIDDSIPSYIAPGSSVGKSDTIFGISLEKVIKKYGGPIPPIVKQCVEVIRGTALKEVGIFRLSGVASQIDGLGREFNSVGAKPDLNIDCNAVAGALKKFFRELPEPLFTFDAHDNFLAATRDPNKIEALKNTLQTIPRENYLIIYYLMKFLNQVSQYSEINKMASNNIGIVFGPTLMRNKEESLSGMMNPMNNPTSTIATLVENFTDIFGNNDPPEFSVCDEVKSDIIKKPPPVKPRRDSNPPATKQNYRLSGGFTAPKEVPSRTGRSFTALNPLTSSGNLASVLTGNVTKSNTTEKPPPIAPKPVIPPKPELTEIQKPPPIAPKPIIPPKPTLSDVHTSSPVPSIPPKPSLPPKPTLSQPKEYAVALYDYTGDVSLGQIDFKEGDKIEIIKKNESGWWEGDLNGKKGLVPMNFIQELEEY